MASPFGSAVMPVWQDPFVEVIKYGMTHRNVGWLTRGDVDQDQDKHLHKNVFRIRGSIAATNYLRVPRDAAKGTHGLGLTGRYAYIQVRRIQSQHMTIHLDFVTNKKTSLRFTLSSIYRTLRSAGTVLRVPIRLDERWTVVVVDMVSLLELHAFNQHTRDTYRHLKTITLCASMNVRNFFVSSTLYSPTTLPSALRFPGEFGAHYNWVELPPRTSMSTDVENNQRVEHEKQESIRGASTPDPAVRERRSSVESTTVIHEETVVKSTDFVREDKVVTNFSPETRDANLRHDRNAILSKADQILRDAGIFDVEIETDNNQEVNGTSLSPQLNGADARRILSPRRGHSTRIESSSTKAEWPDPILELDRIIGFSNNFSHTLLWIPGSTSCVYTTSSTIVIREFCDEPNIQVKSPQAVLGKIHGSTSSIDATKGTSNSSGSVLTTREQFLHGHSAPICVLAVAKDGSILASAETPINSKTSGIRLWSLGSHECMTVVKAQAKGVHALCFSAPTKQRLLLCAVGRDDCSRTQIFIWDCSSLQQGDQGHLSAAVTLMARQTSDFPIVRIAFSPYEQQDQYHLVSCGRENVRYWRVNPSSGHLTGCPVILNEYSRGTIFTDLGYDTIVETHPSNIQRVRPLYVTSSLGTLLVIDYDSKQVLCVYQLHDASINCLSVNEGFCVTGSDDCFLRVWPLDFTDYFLEAHHEAGVSCLDVSADGMKVVVGSRNNAIGVLDIADQQYGTVLRSHTKGITAMTTAPWGSPLSALLIDEACGGRSGPCQSELVTASLDGTLRVWDVASGQQLYEFDIKEEAITCLAASPTQVGIIAVGFSSGCTRIFNVHHTDTNNSDSNNAAETPSSMLREFWQHQSSIRHIAFDCDGQHLYTSGAGKQLCLYDAREQDYVPLKMLLADFPREDGHFVLSQDKKWLAILNGDRKGILVLDPCSLRVIATVQPPRSASNSVGIQEDKLKLVRFSNNTSELLALSESDRVHIFSLPTRTFVQSMPLLGQGGISSLIMSANSKYMVTGGVDGSLRVWNWDDSGRIGRMHQSFLGHAGKINDLGFTNDGQHIVVTGESSAVCIWEFHGDPRPTSPRVRVGTTNCSSDHRLKGGYDSFLYYEESSLPPDTHSFERETTLIDNHGKYRHERLTPPSGMHGGTESTVLDEITSNGRGILTAHAEMFRGSGTMDQDNPTNNGLEGGFLAAGISSKASFRLSLEPDALMLGGSSCEQHTRGDSEFKSSMVCEEVPVAVVQEKPGANGRIALFSTIAGFDPSLFAWSCSTGNLVFAREAALVVEDIASGRQTLFDDCCANENASNDSGAMLQCSSTEIILMQLSPGGETVATISSRLDFITIRSLSSKTVPNGASTEEAHTLIRLAPGTSAVTALAFGHRSQSSPIEELVCVACEIGGPQLKEQIVVLSSINRETIIWSSVESAGWVPKAVKQIVAKSESQFLLFCGENNSVSSVSLHHAVRASVDTEASNIELRSLIDVFPTQVQRICLSTKRYLVGADNDRYCYFYDLRREVFIATTQLLVPTKTNESKTVTFFEWITTAGKSLLISGSTTESTLHVHSLPVVSTKHSTRTVIDWERLTRGGIALLYSIPLGGGGLLRSLSVDPVRDVGLATTHDGTIVLAHFQSSPTVKVLRTTITNSTAGFGESNASLSISQASWALDGTVILTLSRSDGIIRVWLPELTRELTRFQVASAVCTCFAVNPFQTSTDDFSQSVILAGYSDGSLRVFDLREMQLLSRFELTLPTSSKSTDVHSFDRIVIIGAFTALVVTSDHRVFMVDFTHALKTKEVAQTAQGPNIRARPCSRGTTAATKKRTQQKASRKMKPSVGNRKNSQEVVYRELNLHSTRQSQRKRLESVAKNESAAEQVRVGAIDVMQEGNLKIHPFVVVVNRSIANQREGKCVAIAFADSGMNALSEEMAPSDKWRLEIQAKLDQTVVVFTTTPSPAAARVLYPCRIKTQDDVTDDGGGSWWWWGLEIRDCVMGCVVQRLAFDIASPCLDYLAMLRYISVVVTPDSPETEQLLLLVDEDGRMAALDRTRHLLPIDSKYAPTLQLCSTASILTKGNKILLTSPTHVTVATLHLQN